MVLGGQGSDRVSGGDGVDLMEDGPFRETAEDDVSGGDGNDVIFVDNRPAYKDVVVCGDGFDRVLADRKDEVAEDCERVAIGGAEAEEVFGPLDEAGFFDEFEEGLAPFPGS